MKLMWIAVLLLSCVPASHGYQGISNMAGCQALEDKDRRLECKKNYAGNLQCKDLTACNERFSTTMRNGGGVNPYTGNAISFSLCSDKEAARRIGMTCKKFPWYNGGYPMMAELDWDAEWEIFDCTQTKSYTVNGMTYSYCHEWNDKEYGTDEYELGTFTCQTTAKSSDGSTYCKTWTSIQRETKMCSGASSCTPNCREPTFCQKTCCRSHEDNHGRRYQTCEDCSYTPETQWEYSSAECTSANAQGVCLEWKQEEWDEASESFIEYEEYTCDEISKSGKYCTLWHGSVDSELEFEMASCECVDSNDADRYYCTNWECYEQGMEYFFPSLPFSLVSIVLPLPILAITAFFYFMRGDHRKQELFFFRTFLGLYVIVYIGLQIATIFTGGIMNLILGIIFNWIFFPLCFFVPLSTAAGRKAHNSVKRALSRKKIAPEMDKDRPAYAYGEKVDIHVGPWNEPSPKTVEIPAGVVWVSKIPNNPQAKGWTDTFNITFDLKRMVVEVQRSDAHGGWGQQLVLSGFKGSAPPDEDEEAGMKPREEGDALPSYVTATTGSPGPLPGGGNSAPVTEANKIEIVAAPAPAPAGADTSSADQERAELQRQLDEQRKKAKEMSSKVHMMEMHQELEAAKKHEEELAAKLAAMEIERADQLAP